MTWIAFRNAALAGLNEFLPVVGICAPGPCPPAPTTAEILWWHAVTVLLVVSALWSVVAEARGYPENQAYRRDA